MEYKQITLTEIYIPICFYFNMEQLKQIKRHLQYLHSNMFLF